MEEQHCDPVSVDLRLEFSPIEPVPEHVIVVRPMPVLNQCDLGHEILVVGLDVADDGEVPPGVRDVHVDDFAILARRLTFYISNNTHTIIIFSSKRTTPESIKTYIERHPHRIVIGHPERRVHPYFGVQDNFHVSRVGVVVVVDVERVHHDTPVEVYYCETNGDTVMKSYSK